MKTCKLCQTDFEVTDKDWQYYQKVDVPSPTLCPTCRAQRRLAWRNERKLYVSKSDLSGERLISIFSPDKPYKVYSTQEWWSDKYNPLDYGRDYDFDRPFFEQFNELMWAVPHMSLIGANNEDCDYCHLLANCKHCYMITESSNNEDCLYGYWLQKCLGCVDSSFSHESRYCYEIDNCYNCYNLKWSQDCTSCSDSYFLKDSIGCKNCFGCINLHQKQYYIFNKPHTKEEYEAFIRKIDFDSYKKLGHWLAEAKKFFLTQPHKYAHILNSENCFGDYIMDARYCEECYHAHDAEYCKYGEHVWRGSKNNMDVSTVGREAEWVYEAINTGISSFNVQFSVQNWTCSDMQYSYGSHNSSHSFGCVGLKRNEYCILNKQYSKEEYGGLRSRIVEQMKKNGEYGEFFPASISPFGYNETVAHEQYPLTKNEVAEQGFKWSDYEAPLPDVEKVISAEKLPDNSKDIPDDVLNWAIKCQVSGRPFRLTKEELKFYREHHIPIPRLHPDERHMERMKTRNPNRLWNRNCAKCNADIKTSYSPDRPEVVYCEQCYLKEVY
ncbi:hypothetical protein KJ657_05515 [Patescibacteria group bacterium]|nr:hypothetical protein [Patescibacteria group bacterium]MBU1016515.1 hypothetical protein [Patescibacteria group bacterium]MBU1685106.1 hypothetical protein [Patescibacteria group bacterium]MBU1938606.1 hypothetical protein [Patescibacteria group bacterium]